MGALQNAIESNTTNINQKTRAHGLTPASVPNVNAAMTAATGANQSRTTCRPEQYGGRYARRSDATGLGAGVRARDDSAVRYLCGPLLWRDQQPATRSTATAILNPWRARGAKPWCSDCRSTSIRPTGKLTTVNSPALQALGDATPVASVGPVNANLGRRYKVVSFRWLNESDL